MLKLDSADINQLSDGAYKFGPFFFSVLFCIFLTRWSHQKYISAIQSNPPLSSADQNVNRFMFVATFVFGLGLVVISTVWWKQFNPGTFLFEGTIERVQPQEDMSSNNLFLRQETISEMKYDDRSLGLLKNEHFLIKQGRPFKLGQKWELDFEKNDQRRRILTIEYVKQEDEPRYSIDYDLATDTTRLKLKNPEETSSKITENLYPSSRVYASTKPQVLNKNVESLVVPGYNKEIPIALQNPSSSVAEKLNAIDKLLALPPIYLIKYLVTPNTNEIFILTILDLAQHSDMELAAKANALASAMKIDDFLVNLIESGDRALRLSVGDVLLRIPKDHAQNILARVSGTALRTPELQDIVRKIASDRFTLVLKPTATNQGDLYFLKVTWNTRDLAQVSCLTQYFSRTLVPKKSLEEEKVMMANRSQRYLDWNDKNSVLLAAREVRQCGATVSGVHPYQ